MSIANETESAESPAGRRERRDVCGERLRNWGTLVTASLLVGMIVLILAMNDQYECDRPVHADIDLRPLYEVERLLIKSRAVLD